MRPFCRNHRRSPARCGSFWRERGGVPAPSDPEARPLRGDGWTLELADGVTVVPAAGGRAGDLTLRVP